MLGRSFEKMSAGGAPGSSQFLENSEKAAQNLKKYIDLNLHKAYRYRAFEVIARLALKRNETEVAEEYIDRGLDEGKNLGTLFRLKGNILIEQGKLPEAILAFRKSLAVEPNNTWTYTGLGTAYSWDRKFEKSKLAYQSALDIDPNNQTARSSLDWVERQTRKPEPTPTLPPRPVPPKKGLDLKPDLGLQ